VSVSEHQFGTVLPKLVEMKLELPPKRFHECTVAERVMLCDHLKNVLLEVDVFRVALTKLY